MGGAGSPGQAAWPCRLSLGLRNLLCASQSPAAEGPALQTQEPDVLPTRRG